MTHPRRSLIFILCTLATLALGAQSDYSGSAAYADAGTPTAPGALRQATASPTLTTWESFSQKARSMHVGARQMDGPIALQPGFYLIAGAFQDSRNIRRLLRQFKRSDLEPGQFINPENQLNYVYAQSYTDPQEALHGVVSKLNGAYEGDLWILAVGLDASEEELAENTYLIQQDPGEKSPDKLIRKADEYFDKMWYAEAAELYESAIAREPSNADARVLKNVADAHYFNTNMERALYWYDRLYDLQSDRMSAENLFRYAHSLKGNGKYARANRFMKLYNRAMETETIRPNKTTLEARQTALDDILNAEDGFRIKNVSVNSKYSDFAPMFYGDDKVVYASSVDSAFFNTRRYKWNDQPYLDLYVARVNAEGEDLGGAVKFSKTLNTKYHEAGVTFSPDGQTIYFTRNNYKKKLRRDKNGVNHLKLYMSHKVGGQWTEAVELPFNGEDYSTGHPALSPDGKQLYFASDMPGSIGETDIFVVDVLGDGQFSEPRNLGPEINTEKKELFPFINGEKLYFSSDGHLGLGGLDVYEVSFDAEAESGFLEVRNVGKPINSNKDDFSFIINEDTQKGYFASNRRGGKGDDDLYSFQRLFPEEANENAIAGVVTDLITGEKVPDAMVGLLDSTNVKLKEMVTDDGGSFVFEDLESNTRYKVVVDGDTYQQQEWEVETGNNEPVNMAEMPLRKLEERIIVEQGVRKLKTDNIYFDFDRYAIRDDAARSLDKLVDTMNEYPTMVIAIESHTDSRGKRAYNKYLSEKRAQSTRDYLIRKGIAPARIQSAKGYGEERLLNGCDGSVACSAAQHQLNRRSEFIVVSM
ncbi:OmpA family protein [Robiginitalea sp. M366]|uniref:OmpA family protein n=1 Tax=Robiginitalea aestuariiviva TaxID=3036903 RepID=UPI00240E5506|nr:OmpA family protein [Robiginitalea aestuariiviva]MDG1571491.1 OmpA family protein [Robiginitalea aestuariiviva]